MLYSHINFVSICTIHYYWQYSEFHFIFYFLILVSSESNQILHLNQGAYSSKMAYLVFTNKYWGESLMYEECVALYIAIEICLILYLTTGRRHLWFLC